MTATFSPEDLADALGLPTPTREQAAVISAPLAPTLVVAGAGSGKTETMAGRVVWLVANGIVPRDEILGLTFTRKAAGELAERIGRRLRLLDELQRTGRLPVAGAGMVADTLLERPTVSTYNSFADGLVREHAVRLGRDPEAVVLTEAAAWLLMRRIVLASDDPRLEDRDNALSTIIDAALRIARDGVDNLVDFDELASFAERFDDVLIRPSSRKGTDVLAAVRTAATNVGGLGLLATLATQYRAHKRRIGVIDYADQVAGAFEIVSSAAEVRAELRARYRVVLLDEYQDTSVVQTRLLAALFADSAVMAVGDPHQSIYGWRGASAGNLGGFTRSFAPGGGGRRYSLMTSWRNSERVLAAANAVLAPLSAGAPVEVGELEARPGAPAGDVRVEFLDDVDAEAARVADWFEHVRTERSARGAPTSGAILFRSKKHMLRFAEALARRGIAHRILGLGGLLSTPEVVDVVSALRVISDPTAGSALIRLLTGPRWSIGLPDMRALADLASRLARHDTALQPLAPEVLERLRSRAGEDTGSLIDALDFVVRHGDDHGWLSAFTPAARERLREAGAVFASLRRAAGIPLPELIRLIERELRLDIELAANESRGPARTAGDQLRAFVDELHGFLQADDSRTLSSVLAWLDRAERQDEFMPRTEPPEPDVVQLLTIHGSKGLEWDAVAVVRVVADELPGKLRDGQGWLAFGVLPSAFRGDAPFLPDLDWSADAAPTQQDLGRAIDEYRAALQQRHVEEERRLAYVAVTRARDHLLLTGAPWAGTKKPRSASVFLEEIADALDVPHPAAEIGENPYDGRGQVLHWPLDALGARRERVLTASELVRSIPAEDQVPADDVQLLLRERDRRRTANDPAAPVRIPASRFKDFVADYGAASRATSRPQPERPYRSTQVGTQFHSWVEERLGVAGGGAVLDDALWEQEDEAVSSGDADLAALQRTFLASPWAHLKPIEVETEINVAVENLFGDGRTHVVICKLDAVYERDGRIEIVDWKTGRAPRTQKEKDERMLQLELYRRAYHARHGIPLEEIDVALYYVADDLILRA